MVRLIRDLWTSYKNAELYLGLHLGCDTCKTQKTGYHYFYYNGHCSAFWLGPLCLEWEGDTFDVGKKERECFAKSAAEHSASKRQESNSPTTKD